MRYSNNDNINPNLTNRNKSHNVSTYGTSREYITNSKNFVLIAKSGNINQINNQSTDPQANLGALANGKYYGRSPDIYGTAKRNISNINVDLNRVNIVDNPSRSYNHNISGPKNGQNPIYRNSVNNFYKPNSDSNNINEEYTTQIHKILGDFNIKNHIVDRSIVLNSRNKCMADCKIQVAKGISTFSNMDANSVNKQDHNSVEKSYKDSRDQDQTIKKVDYKKDEKKQSRNNSNDRERSSDFFNNPLTYASDLAKNTKQKFKQGLDYVENLKNVLKKKMNNNSNSNTTTKNLQDGNSNPLKCNCECEVGSETCELAMNWQQSLDIKNMKLLTQTYRDILAKAEREKEYTKQINNDQHRTFPEIDYFKASQDGSSKLENVLIATSCYDPNVGYVQGMNFIGACILYHADETMAFWIQNHMFEVMEIRDIYLPGLPGQKKHSFVFDILFKDFDPKLYGHFKGLGIVNNLYQTEWLMAFGCNIIPLEFIHLFFNGIFYEKWIYFYKVILVYLDSMREDQLRSDELGVLQILKSNSNSAKLLKSRNKLDWQAILEKARNNLLENPNKIYKLLEQYENRPPAMRLQLHSQMVNQYINNTVIPSNKNDKNRKSQPNKATYYNKTHYNYH